MSELEDAKKRLEEQRVLLKSSWNGTCRRECGIPRGPEASSHWTRPYSKDWFKVMLFCCSWRNLLLVIVVIGTVRPVNSVREVVDHDLKQFQGADAPPVAEKWWFESGRGRRPEKVGATSYIERLFGKGFMFVLSERDENGQNHMRQSICDQDRLQRHSSFRSQERKGLSAGGR